MLAPTRNLASCLLRRGRLATTPARAITQSFPGRHLHTAYQPTSSAPRAPHQAAAGAVPAAPPRRVPSSPDPTREWDVSDAQNLRQVLEDHKHDKWGWVIYRTSYADDAAWATFKQVVQERSRKEIAESDAPEIAASLEWTFIEDPALDGVPAEQLRARFRSWAVDAIGAENPRAGAYPRDFDALPMVPRYNYFIEADERALRTVAGANPDDLMDAGWVRLHTGHEATIPVPAEAVDSDQANACSMPIASFMIGPSFYGAMCPGLDNPWYDLHKSPSGITTTC